MVKTLNPKRIKNILNMMEDIIRFFLKKDIKASFLGGKYGELYAYNKLAALYPKIGYERKEKTADIFLNKINKRVEVKWAEPKMISDNYWSRRGIKYGWGFSNGHQIIEEKFDYCLLLCSDKNGKIKHALVLKQTDFKDIKKPRKGGIGTKTYFIHLFKNLKSLRKWEKELGEKAYPLEVNLVRNIKKYDKRWRRIK